MPKINVTSVTTTDYDNKRPYRRGKNKANTKPNKPNFKKGTYTALRSVAQDKFHRNDNIKNLCALCGQ